MEVAWVFVAFVVFSDWRVDDESAIRFVAESWFADNWVVTFTLVLVALVLVLFVEENDWSVDDPRPMKFVKDARRPDNWVVTFKLVLVALVLVLFVEENDWSVDDERLKSPPPKVCSEFQVLVVVVAGKSPRTPRRARASR